ncbi:MAG TPA: T9SS type A sorting domain-containing protein, partial [Bacteroidota bacterium]
TVPGIPMIYSGQEVGYGLGISNFDQRRRGIIDWNSGGKALLSPHYQRLAWIRATYPAFSTQTFNRLVTGNPYVYAYTRPFPDQNGIAVENFNGYSTSVQIALAGSGVRPNVRLTGGPINGKTYYLNDVYNDTSYAVSFNSDTMKFSPTLGSYGSAVYILSDTVFHFSVPSLTSVSATDRSAVPSAFELGQNFPNPFNPSTNIEYALPARSIVTLRVYNILGQMVKELVNGVQNAGFHGVSFDGGGLASGVYFYRLDAGANVSVRKMLLMK